MYKQQPMIYLRVVQTFMRLLGTQNSEKPTKHELVLRRTSWCFVFLWPHHVFTKYFARIIKIHQEQTITYMGPDLTSQKLSRTFYFDNKQKHQLVLRRTSWCFVLLWPRHVFTKYFARIIKIYQEQTITYMGPVVTSQKLSRTFYFDNKQKHQLVLRRTSWCFVLLWPRHVFTKYFARGIRMHQEQPKSYLEPLRTSKTP